MYNIYLWKGKIKFSELGYYVHKTFPLDLKKKMLFLLWMSGFEATSVDHKLQKFLFPSPFGS